MNSDQTERDSASSQDIVMGVWHRRKWLAILVACAGCAAVVTVTLALPSIYRSSASVIVERQEVSEAFVRPSVTAELETRIQTIRQRVESRARLEDVIKRFGLYPEMQRSEPIEVIVDRMRRDIEFQPKVVDSASGRPATIAFTLRYSGRNPTTVAAVTNTLASFYVEENSRSRERQADRTAGFLKEQLTQVKAELDAQERRTGEFTARHSGELPQQLQTNLGALERLNTQLQQNGEYQLRALERRERLEQERRQRLDQPRFDPGSGTPITTPATQLAKLRQDLADLRRRFGDRYPDVLRLNAEIAALERQVGRGGSPAPTAEAARGIPADAARGGIGEAARGTPAENSMAVRAVDDELRSLKQQETLLRGTIASYESRVESAPRREQEIQELSRGYEANKERYQALLKQYQEAQLAATVEQGQSMEQFRILDPALPPLRPSAPNRLWLASVGLIASLALALVVVVVAEKLDTTFHTVEELREFTDVPTLASIRQIVTGAAARRQRYRLAFAGVWLIVALGLIVAASYRVAAGNEQIVRMTARGGI
jgi:protein tyrosine kinase modulator